jgi:hypothetical protein
VKLVLHIADDDILQAFGLVPPSEEQVSSRPHAASTDRPVHASPAKPRSRAEAPVAAAPLRHAVPGTSRSQEIASTSPAQKQQQLWRPALATMRPCSLSSVDWSDVEGLDDRAASRPAAGAAAQAVTSWHPQGPSPSPAMTDTTTADGQIGYRPPRPPNLPPPSRKAAVTARAQQGPGFAAPRMQAPGAHPSSDATTGSAAAAASLVPSAAAAVGLRRPAGASCISQPGAMEFPAAGQERRRRVEVPDSFQKLQQYKHIWTSALMEEASLR